MKELKNEKEDMPRPVLVFVLVLGKNSVLRLRFCKLSLSLYVFRLSLCKLRLSLEFLPRDGDVLSTKNGQAQRSVPAFSFSTF